MPPSIPIPIHFRSTVRLLVPRTRTWTAELLGLAPPVVGDEEGTVVLDKGLLQLVLGVLVDVLLVVGDLLCCSLVIRSIGRFGLSFSRAKDVRSTWRWPGGWRRPGRCDHHRRRGRGCQRSLRCLLVLCAQLICRSWNDGTHRTCRDRGSGRARRP